jgi:hypothetical protein
MKDLYFEEINLRDLIYSISNEISQLKLGLVFLTNFSMFIHVGNFFGDVSFFLLLSGFLNANTDGKSRNPANLGILDQVFC